MPPLTLTTHQAAEMLGVSKRTIGLWADARVLKAWKTPGNHRRILAESVDSLLAQRDAEVGMPAPPTTPSSPSARYLAAQAVQGGKPFLITPTAEDLSCLAALLQAGYGDTVLAVIQRALRTAVAQMEKPSEALGVKLSC